MRSFGLRCSSSLNTILSKCNLTLLNTTFINDFTHERTFIHVYILPSPCCLHSWPNYDNNKYTGKKNCNSSHAYLTSKFLRDGSTVSFKTTKKMENQRDQLEYLCGLYTWHWLVRLTAIVNALHAGCRFVYGKVEIWNYFLKF